MYWELELEIYQLSIYCHSVPNPPFSMLLEILEHIFLWNEVSRDAKGIPKGGKEFCFLVLVSLLAVLRCKGASSIRHLSVDDLLPWQLFGQFCNKF